MTKKAIKIFSSVLLIGGLTLGGVALSASASVVYPPEGGVWNYGVTHGEYGLVWSVYDHGRRFHKSTACNAESCDYSRWLPPRRTARAVLFPSTPHGNTAYYDAR